MKITISPSTVIADHGRESVSNFRVTPAPDVQVAKYIRHNFAKAIARGNLLNLVTFDVFLEKASVTAAETFVLTHAQSLPTSGTIIFEADDQTTKRWLTDGVVEVSSISFRGLGVHITYKIQGGEMHDTDPDA